ncbi:MAG: hypothetical protein ACE5IQ_14585 [Candidatus Methylomirabilales bacterium]
MRVKTNQLIRIICFIAMIGALLRAPIFGANPVLAGNGEGKIEFRLAEPADTPKTILTDFVVAELRGVKYRVSTRAELKFKRTALCAVVVQELEPGEYALNLQVDSSLWSAIETLTTTNKGNYLAIVVDGALISAARVLEPIPDGRLTILYARSKQEGLDLARRFSSTPKFLPLEDTRTR